MIGSSSPFGDLQPNDRTFELLQRQFQYEDETNREEDKSVDDEGNPTPTNQPPQPTNIFDVDNRYKA